MENTDNLYALLIGISKDVGEIKADVKNVQKNVETYNSESVKADDKIASRLEEYFDYAKKRQDDIKDGIERKLKNHEERLENIENKKKNTLVRWWDKARDYIIWAVILAFITFGMKFMSDLVKSVRPPVSVQIEQQKEAGK